MKKQSYIFIFVILAFCLSFSFAFAQPQFPIQVYGDITPDLPQAYDMSFKISGIEYETGTAFIDYGYIPNLVMIPVDEASTTDKEGYAAGDSVSVYINGVLVDTQTYNGTSPIRKDIVLTNDKYNEITEAECARSACTSTACQTRSACEAVNCRWDNSACKFPVSTGGGGGGGGPLPGCYDTWICPQVWSECLADGTQTRLCINDGTCKIARPNKTETQRCAYIPPVVEPPVVYPEIPVEEPTPEIETPPVAEEGGLGWVVYAILVLIVIGGFGFVFYEVEHSRRNLESEKTTHHALVGENTYANLESYIRRTLDMGYSRQQIMQAMLQEGWSQAIINKVFSRIR